LLCAFRRRGLRVSALKSGPDYIDPAFHAAATGSPVFNLDSWAMSPALLDSVAGEVDADLLVIETAMGLFDGLAGPPGGSGTGADLAARFGLPVVLVLDVSGQSQSAAAVARGFAGYDPGVCVAGVILNRVGSERHRDGIFEAMGRAGLRVFGAFPRDAGIALPSRHLGLVQAGEHADLLPLFERLADRAEETLDLDGILACAAPLRASGSAVALPPPGQRIALASDVAFGFCYPHLLAGWRRQGAEIVPFSPLADEAPPEDCDACWLPGGYPELHGETLAGAEKFRAGMQRFAGVIHGECGGYMVLGEGLEDAEGTRHAMLGLLDHATSFAARKMKLGYREARVLGDTALGPAGTLLRGHEFHYATLTDPGTAAPLATLTDGQGRGLGPAGGRRGRVSGSFFHVIARRDSP